MSPPARPYPSDLSDAEWAILAPLIPPAKPGGRPPKWPMRTILDGTFYGLRSGCAWRLLPHDVPPWQTVYHYARLFRLDGTWEQLNATLRERERVRQGRNAPPSACIIDSQSVKTTTVGGLRGYDGAKKISGRKRHLLFDATGLVLRAKVHAADLQDRAGVSLVLDGIKDDFPLLEYAWADQGYTGGGKTWIEEQLGWNVEIVQHPPHPRGEWRIVPAPDDPTSGHFERFRLPPAKKEFRGTLPRRWVGERTFSWISRGRRLAKEYERSCEMSEAMIYATMSRLMLRRLTRSLPFLPSPYTASMTENHVLARNKSILESSEGLTTQAERAADVIAQVREYRWVGVYEVTEDEIGILGWSDPSEPAYPRFPQSQGLCGAAVSSATTVVVNDVTADPRYLITFGSIRGDWGPWQSSSYDARRLGRVTPAKHRLAPAGGAERSRRSNWREWRDRAGQGTRRWASAWPSAPARPTPCASSRCRM